tara:strand:- start:85 stop:729 length:645 start_codon:yes stop_codon:yes gene_type:complete
MLYSPETIEPGEHCSRCGEAYLHECPNCGHDLKLAFKSMTWSSTGKAMSFPKRPAFCKGCGKPFPWTERTHKQVDDAGIWGLLHSEVVTLAKSRFEGGHYADAVEAVFKQINTDVKKLYRDAQGQEFDGVDLMRKAFRHEKPAIPLSEIDTETGRSIQQGYMDIFAGSMAAIRNPKAHGNVEITAERAVHLLMLGSLLFHALDERPRVELKEEK